MVTFGKRLRKLRKDNNLRQKDLAKALGLAQTTIANYEQDIRFPSKEILNKFADFFNISLDYLLGRDNEKNYIINCLDDCLLNFNDFKDIQLLYEQFYGFLIKGQKYKANQLIIKAINNEVDIRDIYINIFEKTLKKVGFLWEQGKIDVFQEHYISSAIETIMSNLYPYIINKNKQKPSIVGLCANGEFHCVGLKMVMDFFEIEGWNTFYLGINMPTESIIKAIKEYKADILAISTTMSYNVNSVINLIQILRKTKDCSNIKILVGGNAFNIDKTLWKKVGADLYAPNANLAVEVVKKSFTE